MAVLLKETKEETPKSCQVFVLFYRGLASDVRGPGLDGSAAGD